MLIARKAINKANLNPSQEIVINFSLIISSPATDRGIITRKKSTKRSTHRNCFSTKLKGILDKKTRIIANISAKEADVKSESRAIENIKKDKDTIFVLGSQE